MEGEKAGSKEEIVDKMESEAAGYVSIRQTFLKFIILDGGFRVDHHSRAGTEYIPQLGTSLLLPYGLNAKLSVSKGFRYPTLREMYMFPPQNPDLKPERMWNYEVSLSQRLLENRLKWNVTFFAIDAENIILTVPRKGATPLNMNSGTLVNRGVETDISYKPGDCWTINANYSFLSMKTPVISAPEHKLYSEVIFTRGKWYVGIGMQYIAGLYTSTSPVVKENFCLLAIDASYDITEWMKIGINLDNLLNSEYEILEGYPMPGFNARAGIYIRL